MSEQSSVELNEPFCSYCGYRPKREAKEPQSRICQRCHLGMVLQGPAGAVPSARVPFVIVDDKLQVQAVSRRAAAALGVDETAAVNVPLEEFLISDSGDTAALQLGRRIRSALIGDGHASSDPLEVRAVQKPRTCFLAKVSSCGAPRAALLVLTPLKSQTDQPAG